ncbi:MAG: protein kinase [Oscillospiraceae bacterium]|nr:protein kinase [Oscillospiraceae bacterium]
MKLIEWVNESRSENEKLDIFWQIVRLLNDSGKGAGFISPILYEVNDENDVTYVGYPTNEHENAQELSSFHKNFRAPELPEEGGKPTEKSDIFSLGLLMWYLTYGEVPTVTRTVSQNPFRKVKRLGEGTVVRAEDSKPISLLMERMTSYESAPRPTMKHILDELNSNICKFGILLVNDLSGECHQEIKRSFASSESYVFIPDEEYVVNCVTLAPISREKFVIPFRLVKKQYTLKVAYASVGRWNNAVKKERTPLLESLEILGEHGKLENSKSGAKVPKSIAALHYCDAVYGVDGDALFCETDGYTYDMGFYEHTVDNIMSSNKKISISKEGSVAIPERLEARILSLLREVNKAVYDMFCVGVYGELTPEVVKTFNDTFPEAVRIYCLTDEDLLKGAALYLDTLESSESADLNKTEPPKKIQTV